MAVVPTVAFSLNEHEPAQYIQVRGRWANDYLYRYYLGTSEATWTAPEDPAASIPSEGMRLEAAQLRLHPKVLGMIV